MYTTIVQNKQFYSLILCLNIWESLGIENSVISTEICMEVPETDLENSCVDPQCSSQRISMIKIKFLRLNDHHKSISRPNRIVEI